MCNAGRRRHAVERQFGHRYGLWHSRRRSLSGNWGRLLLQSEVCAWRWTWGSPHAAICFDDFDLPLAISC